MDLSLNQFGAQYDQNIWLEDCESNVVYRKLKKEDLGREFFALLAQLTESPYPPDLCQAEEEVEASIKSI